VAVRVGQRPLRQRVAYGTIPVQVVTHRLSLLAGGGVDEGVPFVHHGELCVPWSRNGTIADTAIAYDHAPRKQWLVVPLQGYSPAGAKSAFF
jgi:hypothetical protein